MLNALEHFNTSIEDVLELDLSSENPLEYIQKNNGKQKIFQKLDSGSPLFIASANLIKYLKKNQLGDLPHVKPLVLPDSNLTMFLDAVTQSNLELVYPQDKNKNITSYSKY